MHGRQTEQSDRHMRAHRVDPHAHDVSVSAADSVGNRGAIHRGGRGGCRNHSPPCPKSRGRESDAKPGRLHGVPAPHQAELQRGGQHHHRRRARDDARGAAGRRDADEARDELAQHGLDELRALPDARSLLGVQVRVGAQAPREHPRLHLSKHVQGHRIHPARSWRGARHAFRVRVLRRRTSLQSGALPRPRTRQTAAVRADDLRHPRRYRSGSGEPRPHEANGGQAVRRRVLLERARGRTPPARIRHHERDHGRQHPGRPRGQPVRGQGKTGHVERRAGPNRAVDSREPLPRAREARTRRARCSRSRAAMPSASDRGSAGV